MEAEHSKVLTGAQGSSAAVGSWLFALLCDADEGSGFTLGVFLPF